MKLRSAVLYTALSALATTALAGPIYVVEFLATVNGGKVESFEVSRVVSRKSGKEELAMVHVPDVFVAAARKRFSVDRGCEPAKEGERKQCFTIYLYDPTNPMNTGLMY